MKIYLHSKGVINHPVMFSHFKVGEFKTRLTTGEGQTTEIIPVVVDQQDNGNQEIALYPG